MEQTGRHQETISLQATDAAIGWLTVAGVHIDVKGEGTRRDREGPKASVMSEQKYRIVPDPPERQSYGPSATAESPDDRLRRSGRR